MAVSTDLPKEQPQAATQQTVAARPLGGFTSANHTLFDRGFQRTRSQESVTKLQAAVRKIIDQHSESGNPLAKNCEVFSLERSLGLNVAAVVFAYKESYQGKHVACVYPMLIERTADPLPPRTNTDETGTYTSIRVISEYYDNDFWNILTKQAQKVLGDQYEIVDGTGLVIPVEMPEEGESYSSTVAQLVWNASNACFARVAETLKTPQQPFTVSGSAKSKERVDATVYLQPGPASSLSGRRIRQDIAIQMTASSTDNRNTLHGANTPVVTVGGYLELVYKQQNQNQQQMMYNPHIAVPQPTYYTPRFIITNCISEMQGETMEHTLLGIYLSTLISKEGLWKRMLLPNPTSGFDANDFGAVGYEVNLSNDPKAKPAKIDIKGDDVSDIDLFNLVNRIVDQNPVFSMHLSEFDDRTWLHDPFLVLLSGTDADKIAARERIIYAANSLTNGNFSTYFNAEDQIIYGENNRIHQAYYTDSEGDLTDGRSLDSTLPILNYHGAKDHSTVTEWAYTHELSSMPIQRRLADRYRILKGTNSTFNVTGYYQLGTFYPKFLDALGKAIREAGLYIQPNNMHQETGSRVRGNSTLGNFAFAVTHDADGFRSVQNAYDPSLNTGGHVGRYR